MVSIAPHEHRDSWTIFFVYKWYLRLLHSNLNLEWYIWPDLDVWTMSKYLGYGFSLRVWFNWRLKLFNVGELRTIRSKEFQSLRVDGKKEFAWVTVRAGGTLKLFMLRSWYLEIFWTRCGISDCKYWGVNPFKILYNWNNLWLLRLFWSVCIPVSSYNFCILHSFVAPVIIRAASIWMLSKFLLFSIEQLSHIMFAYSKSDHTFISFKGK